MSHPADEYEVARVKLTDLSDEQVEEIAAGYSRPADPVLTAALAEELSRRGLRVRPATEVEPAPPTDDAVIDRATRNGSVRAWRF